MVYVSLESPGFVHGGKEETWGEIRILKDAACALSSFSILFSHQLS